MYYLKEGKCVLWSSTHNLNKYLELFSFTWCLGKILRHKSITWPVSSSDACVAQTHSHTNNLRRDLYSDSTCQPLGNRQIPCQWFAHKNLAFRWYSVCPSIFQLAVDGDNAKDRLVASHMERQGTYQLFCQLTRWPFYHGFCPCLYSQPMDPIRRDLNLKTIDNKKILHPTWCVCLCFWVQIGNGRSNWKEKFGIFHTEWWFASANIFASVDWTCFFNIATFECT